VPVVVPVEQRTSVNWSESRRNPRCTKYPTPLELCPRIMVFRPFLDQLPKLDVAGSTPVARSFVKALTRQRFFF
jgi:hypothetical protein